jgi:hypothetical protein
MKTDNSARQTADAAKVLEMEWANLRTLLPLVAPSDVLTSDHARLMHDGDEG